MNGRESLLLPVRLTLDATTIDTRQRGAYGAASVWVQLSNPNQQAVRNAKSSRCARVGPGRTPLGSFAVRQLSPSPVPAVTYVYLKDRLMGADAAGDIGGGRRQSIKVDDVL